MKKSADNHEISPAKRCRLCGSHLRPFLRLERAPLAGNLSERPFDGSDGLFPIEAFSCRSCSLIQLTEAPPAGIYEKYVYTPAHSAGFKKYASWLCDDVMARYSPRRVVEIGSSDGVLIDMFATRGAASAGYEPSAKLARAARDPGAVSGAGGAYIINDYFGPDTVKRLPENFGGAADAVVIRHVLEHIDGLDSMMKAICRVLDRERGVLVLEVPYAGDIITQNQFYAFFHEHVSYFSYGALEALLKKHGLVPAAAFKNDLEGGSVLIYAVFEEGARAPEKISRPALFDGEEKIFSAGSLSDFSSGMASYLEGFSSFIKNIRSQGRRVCAWGAGQRGVSLVNMCSLTSADIEFIIDVNPKAQYKFIPGGDIQVLPPAELEARKHIDSIAIFATGYAPEIIASCGAFVERGGRFISIIPRAGWMQI